MHSFSVSINQGAVVDCDFDISSALFYLNFNAVKAAAVQFKDLTFPEVMIACMCIDLTAAGLQMTTSGKETLASRWFVLASALNQIVAATIVVAMLARIRNNYSISSDHCALINWWGRIDSCTGPSASTWLYIAVRWCITYHGLWLDWRHSQTFHIMEKEWRLLANGDQETDKQKSEYDQTEYQYMRLRATVFSKWLEFIPSILVGMAGIETLVRRVPLDSLITDWGQSAALALAIAGGIHWAYVIYQVLLELLEPDYRKLRSVNYSRYHRDSHPKEEDLDVKFIEAARTGDAKAVRRLLQQNADVDTIDDDKMTALLYAVKLDNLDLVIELMSAKPPANPTRADVTPAVSFAAEKGSMQVLQYFIPKAAAESSSSLQPTQRVRQLFVRNLTMVFLSKKRAQLNPYQSDLKGRSLLWLAAVNGHREVVEHICAVWKQDAIYAAFLTTDQSTKRNLLWKMATHNKHNLLEDFILKVCPEDIQVQTLREALDDRYDSASAISSLLRCGAGRLEIDEEGSTVLHQLCRDGLVEPWNFSSFLDPHLVSGLPTDVFDKKHRTPLLVHIAGHDDQNEDQYHYVAELCSMGANPFEQDFDGETPFSLAIKKKNVIAIEAFFLKPGSQTRPLNDENFIDYGEEFCAGFSLTIDQEKLLSHLWVLPDDAVSWLCSHPINTITSDRDF